MRCVSPAFTAIKTSFTHQFRQQSQPPGHAVDDFLNDQHALWAAKTTKGGIRGQIGFCRLPAELHGGDVIGVVEVEQCAVRNGLRKVNRPASVGIKVDACGQQASLSIETDFKASEEWMPMAGEHH